MLQHALAATPNLAGDSQESTEQDQTFLVKPSIDPDMLPEDVSPPAGPQLKQTSGCCKSGGCTASGLGSIGSIHACVCKEEAQASHPAQPWRT